MQTARTAVVVLKRVLLPAVWLTVLCGCVSLQSKPAAATSSLCGHDHGCAAVVDEGEDALAPARRWQTQAERRSVDASPHKATAAWLQCAIHASLALKSARIGSATDAAGLVTRCSDGFLSHALARSAKGWSAGRTEVDGHALDIELRGLSPYLQGPLRLSLARDASMAPYEGDRHLRPGFGVPLAAITPRCRDAEVCALLPPEGVFRNLTAWIEADPSSSDPTPRLVLVDTARTDAATVGGKRLPLAVDTSAAYARGVQSSKLHRLAIWGLLGGREVGRRSGLYLLEDYDPNKRPLVMIHGLGSSPLAWARLSNAIWARPDLRARYQIWHVVYQTDAPLLIQRRRVQSHLDRAWRILDPEGDDPARDGMVLIGHSLGGVIARMLCVDSGETLWSAAFQAPAQSLRGDPADLRILTETFIFRHYPGVTRAIFLASPHRGSPSANRWFGDLAQVLVGRRSPEVQALRRVARANLEAVRPSLRRRYLEGRLNSISTLQLAQPVRLAGESLMPAAGIRYHSIAGALAGRMPETDGYVPLSSALLEGAQSTLVIDSGHELYRDPLTLSEILRIVGD